MEKITDRIKIIKDIIDLAARQVSRTYGYKYNIAIFKDLENGNIIKDLNTGIKKNNVFVKRHFKNIYELNVYRNFLYYLIRIIRPAEVLETGVFHGLTTLWILQALHDNDFGCLTSIDLPRREWGNFFPNREMGAGHQGEEELPADCDPGWIVPDKLKDRWELQIGPSELLLEKVLKKHPIDFFIHDSDHSYETMKYEIETVIHYNVNCFIAVDNYDHSNFIYEFLAAKELSSAFINELDEFNDIFPRLALLKMGLNESSEQRWASQLKARKNNMEQS